MGDAALWRGFSEIAAALAVHGVPRPSPAWLAEVERFYMHPTATTWIACVGRGGGKNLVGILCDLTELLFGDFDVPPGERHYHVHVSENRTEAEKTLRQMAQYLRMLGIDHEATVDTIDLGGELADRGEKVLAARIGANSGFRSTGGTTQESAKWSNGLDAANPAEEIVTSWSAQMVTHATARKRHFSTPMARDGFFFDALTRGETGDQIVTVGPTWVFNPSVSEARTRVLAPNPRTWRREYMAEPQAGALSAFDADQIDAAIAHPRPDGLRLRRHLVIDASSGRKDAFTFAVAGWVTPAIGASWRPYIEIAVAGEVSNEIARSEGANAVITRIARVGREHNVLHVHGDQRDAPFISDAFAAHGMLFTQYDWTAKSKPEAVERVRTWLREGSIALPSEPKMRSQLLAFEERIAPSGQFTFGARGSGHDDYPALLVTAAMASLEGDLVHEEPDMTVLTFGGSDRGLFGDTRRDPYLLALLRARHNS